MKISKYKRILKKKHDPPCPLLSIELRITLKAIILNQIDSFAFFSGYEVDARFNENYA